MFLKETYQQNKEYKEDVAQEKYNSKQRRRRFNVFEVEIPKNHSKQGVRRRFQRAEFLKLKQVMLIFMLTLMFKHNHKLYFP